MAGYTPSAKQIGELLTKQARSKAKNPAGVSAKYWLGKAQGMTPAQRRATYERLVGVKPETLQEQIYRRVAANARNPNRIDRRRIRQNVEQMTAKQRRKVKETKNWEDFLELMIDEDMTGEDDKPLLHYH